MSWQTRQKTPGLVRVGIIFYIYINISSFYTRQYLRQEHPQHSIYSHTIIGSSGDTMWLQGKPEICGYDILSPPTTRKVHLAGLTTVHRICRLQ